MRLNKAGKNSFMVDESNIGRLAIVSIAEGIVHLDCDWNPDAPEDDERHIQQQSYASCGWHTSKFDKALSYDFWGVWDNWNGNMCGGIDLYDDCTYAQVRKEVKGLKVIKNTEICEQGDGQYLVVVEPRALKFEDSPYALLSTEVGDDIDMLINAVLQLRDKLPDGEDDATVQIPNMCFHCKTWEEIEAGRLANLLEKKYKFMPRLKIPERYLTGF